MVTVYLVQYGKYVIAKEELNTERATPKNVALDVFIFMKKLNLIASSVSIHFAHKANSYFVIISDANKEYAICIDGTNAKDINTAQSYYSTAISWLQSIGLSDNVIGQASTVVYKELLNRALNEEGKN